MSIKSALLLLMGGIFLSACGPSQSQAESDLVRDWSAPGLSPRERAAVLSKFFTNGTPVAAIVRVLGPNYIRVTPYSMISMDGSPVMCWLEYTNERVTIGTSARVGSGQDLLAATFTGAGYQLEVQPSTNGNPFGQPKHSADDSQPFRPVTIHTSLPAGSHR